MSDKYVVERQSEEQWLEERRARVTATDIARLARGGPATFAAVKAEKLHGARTFYGNRYTDHGREREPFIMAVVEFEHDITPNEHLYVNGGRAATPDGVGGDRLAEVKTTVIDWPDIDAALRAKPEYADQMLWAQLVCDMDETVFAWEAHDNFVPLPIRQGVFRRDEKRIGELVEVEARFLDYLHEPDEAGVWDEFMARYAEAARVAEEAQAVVDALKAELRERVGDAELAVKTPYGSISYSLPKPRASFDTVAFRKAHVELAEQFTKLVPAKAPTLRITL